ncbi:MAG: SRPBCC domain-containing protein [Chitinophagaceae bacterium]|nr:MAG: SRPBCC domain-containing protein [Chitinophagaceae bacterium]
MSVKVKQFTHQRTFNASRDRVFAAFKTAEALAKWWGPAGAPIDVISLEFKPGGHFHYRMNGTQIHYGIFHFKSINEPDSITWVNSFADEKGNIIKPPFEGIDIPKEMLNQIEFMERDGRTTLSLTSEPVNADESEINTFNAMHDSFKMGFTGTLDQLEEYLAS